MSAARDWFDFAMTIRPYWLVLMVTIGVGLAASAYAPRRRRAQEDHGFIPLRDDDRNSRGRNAD